MGIEERIKKADATKKLQKMVLLTQEQHQWLMKRASKRQLSFSAYVREMLEIHREALKGFRGEQ